MAQLIFYGPDPAAIAADRVYLLPPIDQLGLEHPLGRFVAWMAMYAHAIEEGELPGPYDHEGAETYARAALIDEAEFRLFAQLDDTALAKHFHVPREQIFFRRVELDLDPPANGNGS